MVFVCRVQDVGRPHTLPASGDRERSAGLEGSYGHGREPNRVQHGYPRLDLHVGFAHPLSHKRLLLYTAHSSNLSWFVSECNRPPSISQAQTPVFKVKAGPYFPPTVRLVCDEVVTPLLCFVCQIGFCSFGPSATFGQTDLVVTSVAA